MAKKSLNSTNGIDAWRNTIRIKGPILCPPSYNELQSSLEEGEEADGVCTVVRVKSLSSEEFKISITADLRCYCGFVSDSYSSRTISYVQDVLISYGAYADVTVSFDVTYKFEGDFVKNLCDESDVYTPDSHRLFNVEVSDPVFSDGKIGFYPIGSKFFNADEFTQDLNLSGADIEMSLTKEELDIDNSNLCFNYPYTRPGGVELPFPYEYGTISVTRSAGSYSPSRDKRGRAKITFLSDDNTPVSEGTSITLESTDGTSITYTGSSDPTPDSAEFNVGGTIQDMVLSLISAIESQHGDKFMFEKTIGGDREVVVYPDGSAHFTIYQTKIGTQEDAIGNTDITISGNSGPTKIQVNSNSGGSLNPSNVAFIYGKISDWGEDGQWQNDNTGGPWLSRLTEEEHRPPTTGRMKGIAFNAKPRVIHDTKIKINMRGSFGDVDVSSIVNQMTNHIRTINYKDAQAQGETSGGSGPIIARITDDDECDTIEEYMPKIHMNQGGAACGRYFPSLPNHPVYQLYMGDGPTKINEEPYVERGTKPTSLPMEVQCDFDIVFGEKVDASQDYSYVSQKISRGETFGHEERASYSAMSLSKETERIASNKILFKYDEKKYSSIHDKNIRRTIFSTLDNPIWSSENIPTPGTIAPIIKVSKPYRYSVFGRLSYAPIYNTSYESYVYPEFSGTETFQASFDQSLTIPAAEIEVEYIENDAVGTRQEEQD